MVLTPSTMLDLGTRAPDFALPDPSDNTTWTLDDVYQEKQVVAVIFLCKQW